MFAGLVGVFPLDRFTHRLIVGIAVSSNAKIAMNAKIGMAAPTISVVTLHAISVVTQRDQNPSITKV